MSQPASAVIIPFPRRRDDLAASARRLAAAMTNLSAALVQQQEATQRWRDALLTLSARLHTAAAAPR